MCTRIGLRYLGTLAVAGSTIPPAGVAFSAPVVTAVAPASGNTAGGTPVTVTGAGFLPGATVEIGGVPCAAVNVVSEARITCVTGPRAAGPASVTVINPPADASAANALFTYNSLTDLTLTTRSDFESPGSVRASLTTSGLDSTLRWTDRTPLAGGAMASGAYYYVVTALNAAGESRRSVESAAITLGGGNGSVRLGWTPIAGATGYRLYRATTPGGYASPALIATLDAPGHVDAAAAPSPGSPPAANGATGDLYLARGTAPAGSFAAGPATSGAVGRDAFALARPGGTFLVVHAGGAATTSLYDPAAGTMSPGPAAPASLALGAHAVRRPDGAYLVVHGGQQATTSIYDPVANTFAPGPATSAACGRGGHAILRPDGTFLILHGDVTRGTSLYDPAANTMAAGPELNGGVGDGAFSLRRPDGKFTIVRGNGGAGITVYDPATHGVAAAPPVTAGVGDGGHGIERPDGRYLIVHAGNLASTTLYDPVTGAMSAGPAAPGPLFRGAHAIQRADGTFLLVAGSSGPTAAYVYDPVAGTFASGPALPDPAGEGSHALQLPDGRYLVVAGGGGTATALYDAGWRRAGEYVSAPLAPADINFWNAISWVRDRDDTVAVRVRTAASAAALAASPWRAVADGGSIGAAAGETWLQIAADFARAVPESPLAQRGVWGRGVAHFRAWPAPCVASFTASYASGALSVAPSKALFAFDGRPLDAWTPADSSSVRNDGTVAHTLLGRISVFAAGADAWAHSPTANGPDRIRAQWSTASTAGPWTDVPAYDRDFTIATGVAPGESVPFYFRIQTPTSSASLGVYSSTLTLTAQ